MDIEQKALERLKTASALSLEYYKHPLLVLSSGGKDNSVCVELARRAGIPFEVLHSHTTVDAPETVLFVRSEFKRLEDAGIKCHVEYPKYKGRRTSMWALIPQKSMPPTRLVRYCCSILKENGGANRFCVTGVRWDESRRRKGRGIYEKLNADIKKRVMLNTDNDDARMLFEACNLKAKRVVNPIIDWRDKDVLDFCADSKIPLNPLYECGWKRVGCIGCPLAGRTQRYKEFAKYPRYKQLYIKAFDKMVAVRKARGKDTQWTDGRDVFRWWMEEDVLPGQETIYDYLDRDEDEDIIGG